MKKKYLLILMLFAFQISRAQLFEPFQCAFVENGKSLQFPGAGGLNLPQTYTCDINNDGLDDLVIMDRDGGAILPFLRTSNSSDLDYTYAPGYKSSFSQIREWFVVRDFNQDGIMDIFCFPSSNLPGIEVRKGYYQNDTIKFEILSFTEILGAPDILPIPSSNGLFTQLYVGSNDQPEIIDVDEDGDMDVVTFDAGGSYLNYWKNYTLEKGLGLDTFSMELEDNCWGKFYEKETSEELLLSSSSDECATLLYTPVVDERHAGSCVTLFDENGDGAYDLLLGDLSNDNIIYCSNGGTSEDAWMISQDLTFPSYDVPIDFDLFNAAFYLDVNNDGKRDLLASPNANANIENYEVNWYYKNVGTDASPIFEYRKNAFLVEDMIDVGSASSPAFVDHNQDGLLDLVLGCRGRYLGNGVNDAKLYYFENTGTLTQPEFTLISEDYASYAQYASESLSFYPSFGDLDGDGDIDLLVGDNNGYLRYSENIAGPGNPFEFQQAISQFMDIRPGNVVRPFIIDLNEDGLGDIVLGERNNDSDGNGKIGALNFYENIGEVGTPLFESDESNAPNINALGGVNTQTIIDVTALTAPAFYDQGDKLLLFTGSRNGRIHMYDNVRNNLDGEFNLITDNLGNIQEGQATIPAVVDINNDGMLEIFVGNERGGLAFYQTDILASDEVSTNESDVDELVTLYPNPAKEKIYLSSNKYQQYIVLNAQGKEIVSGNIFDTRAIDISNLSSGIYFLKATADGIQTTLKFLKI